MKTLKEKIFDVLVTRGEVRSAAQLASSFRTTKSSVTARISEIRDAGFAVYLNSRKDTKGRVRFVYQHGNPSRQMVRKARAWERTTRFWGTPSPWGYEVQERLNTSK